jgi:eukaryotic-like serine/threonine-protein kinase
MPLNAGDRLDSYVILAPIGAGGMGEVYRARDERLERDVALKVVSHDVRHDPRAAARFQREAHAVAALSHPNIVAIHHFATSGEITYFVMELLDGETLRDRLARSALPWPKVAEIGAQLAEGLAAAHASGVIHRDLKPANVVVRADGLVKILDFGLARSVERREPAKDEQTDIWTGVGAVVGTPGYMSPEQAAGDSVDARSDIFSLGCVLYEMLGRLPPFRRESAAASMAAVFRDEPETLAPELAPLELQRIIGRCLRKDPAERYQSARDLAIDLRALLTTPALASLPKSRRPGCPLVGAIALAAILLVLLAALWWRRPAPQHKAQADGAPISSLAVLPFENSTRNADAEFLTDGITEGLINSLAKLPTLHVVARTTAFTYKGKPLDLDRVRSDLGVRAVLTGKVTVQARNLIVQVDLVDLDTKAQLWGQRYLQTVDDPIVVEQAIVSEIADRLRIELTRKQQAAIDTPATQDSEAYRSYLKGRYEWNKRSPEGLRAAKVHFQEAIDRDPSFSLAYAGLADTYNLMGGAFRLLPHDEAAGLADAAARRALEIDPDLADAHASLGLNQANQFRFRSAERELRAAIALNPSYASARVWLSLVLRATGRRDEALAEVRKAYEVDPLSPHVATNLASSLRDAGDLEGALKHVRKALDLNPKFPYAMFQLGLIHEERGQYEAAAECYRAMKRVPSPASLAPAALARALAKSGRRGEAMEIVRGLERNSEKDPVTPTQIAWVYAALGDRDRAFFWLNKALASRDVTLRDTLFLHSICVAELKTDPRFADLVKRIRSLEQ